MHSETDEVVVVEGVSKLYRPRNLERQANCGAENLMRKALGYRSAATRFTP